MDPRIPAAAKGNTDALAALLMEQHDWLLALLKRKLSAGVHRSFDAEDVLQQVYVEAFQGIGRFEPRSDHAFRCWLEAIAEHRLIDAVRVASAQKRGGHAGKEMNCIALGNASYVNLLEEIAAELTSPSGVVARDEALSILRLQLSLLSEDQRQAVELRHLHGLNREEIATRMGRTPDEVRGLIYRGMEQLRERMGSMSLYLSRRV